MTAPASSIWNIHLSAWIIQDGNYPDFAVGQTAEFAVEFFTGQTQPVATAKTDVSAKHTGLSGYDVVARSVLQTPELAVLDVGILIYSEQQSRLQGFPPGHFFEANLDISVDPYFYFQFFAKDQSVPPMIYSWRILSMLRQTGPMIEVADDSGRKMRMRDPARLGYEEIDKTDAWHDDGEYILRCGLLPIEPKRISATAI